MRALAQRIAARLAEIDGDVAVAPGGSAARGEARPGPRDPVNDLGAGEPWIDGGAWLQIEAPAREVRALCA